MKLSAYRYCVQFQDGVEANECEWWAFEHLKDSPNFEMARVAFQTPWEVLYKADNYCPDLVAGAQILWPWDEAEPKDISVFYSILFGIPIIDWMMQEMRREGVINFPTALSEMYYEGFQAIQEKIRLWREDRSTVVSQLSDDQYAILLDLAKVPATTVAQNLNSLIDKGEQYSTGQLLSRQLLVLFDKHEWPKEGAELARMIIPWLRGRFNAPPLTVEDVRVHTIRYPTGPDEWFHHLPNLLKFHRKGVSEVQDWQRAAVFKKRRDITEELDERCDTDPLSTFIDNHD